MATVIVPAHNEATVIADCLDSIVNQADVGHVIVACNGCTDETAKIVRDRFPSVHCLEIQRASKVNALNVAEAKAIELGLTFPVFYVDADTTLGEDAISRVCRALEKTALLLAAPTPVVDTSQSSWFVKRYYDTWLNLPYIKEGVIATCCYVLTEPGRQRFGRFLDVINDDGYVRCQFKSSELGNIPDAEIHIRAPRNLYSLIKIKTRARLGNMQLRDEGHCAAQDPKHYGLAIARLMISGNPVSVAVYLGIAAIIRFRAWSQRRGIEDYEWEKDLTSR